MEILDVFNNKFEIWHLNGWVYKSKRKTSLLEERNRMKSIGKINHYLIIVPFLYNYYKCINRGQLNTMSMYMHLDSFYFPGTIVRRRSWLLIDEYKRSTYHVYEYFLVCIWVEEEKKRQLYESKWTNILLIKPLDEYFISLLSTLQPIKNKKEKKKKKKTRKHENYTRKHHPVALHCVWTGTIEPYFLFLENVHCRSLYIFT